VAIEEGNPSPLKKERPCSNTLTASEYEGSAKAITRIQNI
jgi:hypothetical protein